jgi:RecA/RadA recombinase
MPIERVDFGRERLDTVEDMFDDLSDTVKRKGRCLYILDSLDALSDREEMARDMDKGNYGTKKAKNMSEMFRRITGTLHDAKLPLMIVSQIRDNIGATFMMRKTTRVAMRSTSMRAKSSTSPSSAR